MAEYTKGQEKSAHEHFGHNNNREQSARRRLQGVDFEAVNFEQRRAPYGTNTRTGDSEMDAADYRNGRGTRRDEA